MLTSFSLQVLGVCVQQEALAESTVAGGTKTIGLAIPHSPRFTVSGQRQ